ncbi:MAG: peptidoglycan editing factor PgeF [Phenylobacterium sp.]
MTLRPVEFLTSSRLQDAGVRHGFFTRRGGVSEGIYAGLNAGPGSGDDPARVAHNQSVAAGALELPVSSLSIPHQVHSAIVHVAERPFGDARPQGDGVAARAPTILCGVLAADCAPVLLADPVARVVCAVHAGWRGALAGVVEAGVAAMTRLGAQPAAIIAAIGPCIGPESYEVGPEFRERVISENPESDAFFEFSQGDRLRFNLPAYVLARLARAGVVQTEWIGEDTYSDPERFFSNRRALHRGEPDFGRLLSAISLTRN